MAATSTTIEWTDRTWNPVVGCSVVSPGCTNCYAMRQAARIERMGTAAHYVGLTQPSKAGPVWTGATRVAWHLIEEPLSWRRPARIFVNSMSDLFHEGIAEADIAVIFGAAIAAVHLRGHIFQILTKRAARMAELLRHEEFWDLANAVARGHVMDRVDPLARRSDDARATLDDYGPDNPPPGIWLGVSVEDQRRAEERIPHLLDTPAVVRWISAEPLLGPLDLSRIAQPNQGGGPWWFDALNKGRAGWYVDKTTPMDEPSDFDHLPRLDWVVAGGESGPDARPMHPDWARSLRDQCETAGVPFLFKQWGEWVSVYDRDAEDPDWRRVPTAGDWSRKRFMNLAGGQGFHGDAVNLLSRVGKRAAGRLLDGVTHNAFPEVSL